MTEQAGGPVKPRRVRGPVKLALVTVLALLPFATIGGIVWWIVYSLGEGRTVDPPAVGAGAGDTGGANALGEILAGNDPDMVQRERRLLREGELADPVAWPGGVRLVIAGLEGEDLRVIAVRPDGRVTQPARLTRRVGGHAVTIGPDVLTQGTRLYFGRGAFRVSEDLSSVRDDRGQLLAPVTLPPVPPGETAKDMPLLVEIDLTAAQPEP